MLFVKTYNLQILAILGAFALSSCSQDSPAVHASNAADEPQPTATQSQDKLKFVTPSPKPRKSITPAPSPSVSPAPSASPSPAESHAPEKPTVPAPVPSKKPPVVKPVPAPSRPPNPVAPAPVKPHPVIPRPHPAPITPPKTPVTTPPPAPPKPPVSTIPTSPWDIAGNYVSTNGDFQISDTLAFTMHTQAEISPLVVCKIEIEGTVANSTTLQPLTPNLHLDVSSEKFSALQSTSANDAACEHAQDSFSQPHTFDVPILSAGKGYLILKLDEKSTDGKVETSQSSMLDGFFSDRDSSVDVTEVATVIISGDYSGAFGSYLAKQLPIPKLTMKFDARTYVMSLVDNECAFSITSPFSISAHAGSILISSEADQIVTAPLTTSAAKSFAVFYGRASGDCTRRKQSFISELSGNGVHIEPPTRNGKFGLDFSPSTDGTLKYTIIPN